MKSLTVKHIDAFTAKPFAGNPAAVVLSGDGLTEKQMQDVAREMNLSETAFVLSPSTKNADVRIRWFTPSNEVALCGHATIASFHALAEEHSLGMQKNGSYPFRLETASGILDILVVKEKGKATVKFSLPMPHFNKNQHLKTDFKASLGMDEAGFDKRLPCVVSVNAYIPVRRLSDLYDLRPDFQLMKKMLARKKILGLCVFSTETIDRASTFHSRFFAPNDGIDEDPVTGSANGPLGVYMVEQGLVGKSDGAIEMIGEQGDIIGRAGRVKVEVRVEGGKPKSVAIVGSGVTVLEGALTL
ncbi:MAG TPA: PhzF family phenazine biosynthesis isomerase [Bacteroidota bacterium]|nr:PhzF family phenazine biosynthesis isomerase [Bacteroidota bacterium]